MYRLARLYGVNLHSMIDGKYQQAQEQIRVWKQQTAGNSQLENTIPLNIIHLMAQKLPPLPPTVKHLRLTSNRLRELKDLPPDLISLDCRYNELSELNDLPASLQNLKCDGNLIKGFPRLPHGLIQLTCTENQLSVLTYLPPTLQRLICSKNQIKSIVILPNDLELLECDENLLRELPELPNRLERLYCGHNLLERLPALPASLTYQLYCDHNVLTELPEFPDGLMHISCAFNKLVTLPPLPNNLLALGCSNNLLELLPELPPSLNRILASKNRIKVIPRLPATINQVDFDDNPLHEPFFSLYQDYKDAHIAWLAQNDNNNEDENPIQAFIRSINEVHDVLESRRTEKQMGRNLMGLTLSRPKVEGNAPSATVQALGMANIQSVIGSMLSGQRGNVNQQLKRTRNIQRLRLKEIRSRPFGAPGVGGRRRLKKTRKSRRHK